MTPGARTRSVLAAACLSLTAGAALGQASFTIGPTLSIASNGSGPGDACSGVVLYNYAGSSMAAGKASIVGVVQSFDPIWNVTYIDEPRFSILLRDSGGVLKAQWDSGPLINVHAHFQPFYHPLVIGSPAPANIHDISALGTILTGDQIELRFWEFVDDDACAGLDARWVNVAVTIMPKPPIIQETVQFERFPDGLLVTTGGTGYPTVIVLAGPDGALLASDDGEGDPTGIAAISLDGLPPGEYYLCCAGQGATPDDGFVVTPGMAGGDLVVNWPDGRISEARTNADSLVWYRVILEPPGYAGDLDGDCDVDLTDLSLMLASFGAVCP